MTPAMDPALKRRVIDRINEIIRGVNYHSPTANHFYRLKCRLINGEFLTKKMRENLAWIERDVKKEMGELRGES